MSGKIPQELEHYFLPWELLSQSKKSDGRLYSTYRACLKKEYWPHGQPIYYVFKEIPKSLAVVYDKLSHLDNPHLEVVHSIIEDEDCCLSINEYITPPSCFSNDMNLNNSLSLEKFIQNYHGCPPNIRLSDDDKIQQSFYILLQLTDALITLHSVGLIHGDIHPGNILLTDVSDRHQPFKKRYGDFCVKLVDFDNTKAPKEYDHTVTHLMGAKPFAAPEILDFTHPLDRTDIYSLGCILYYSICGKSPKEYTPNDCTLQNKWVKRIFRRCTASYEARYRTLSALRNDILRALKTPSTPAGKFLQHFPGFRSRTPWKMAVAAYIYFSIILYSCFTLFAVIKDTLSFDDWQKDSLYVILLFIIEILVICDFFHIGERFPQYIYLKDSHPLLNFFIKIATALCIFILFIFLMQFI